MELGDRVYAAERITKKREKRVSIASSRLQMAIPGGIVRAPLPPLHLSLLLPRTSCLVFFFFLSYADSRLRAAAASSTTLTARDIGRYAPTGTGTPSLLPGTQCRSRRRIARTRSNIDRRRSTGFTIGEIIDSLPLTKPRFRAPLRCDTLTGRIITACLSRNVLRYFKP